MTLKPIDFENNPRCCMYCKFFSSKTAMCDKDPDNKRKSIGFAICDDFQTFLDEVIRCHNIDSSNFGKIISFISCISKCEDFNACTKDANKKGYAKTA